MAALIRPRPSEDLLGTEGALTARPFRPAPELTAWLFATFIDEGAPLANEDHEHLREAAIDCLWVALPRAQGGNAVAAQAERLALQGNKWTKARQEQQLEEWFGRLPDFLLTFHADYADVVDDATFCALVEHELYHCAQERDAFGAPKFSKMTGRPLFTIRGHDVEEFVGVVARYGVGAAARQTRALVEAATRPPLIASADIAGCCGTCGRAVI